MKFGKLLHSCDIPEVKDIYRTYKELKKHLKRLKSDPEEEPAANVMLEAIFNTDQEAGSRDGDGARSGSIDEYAGPQGAPTSLNVGERKFLRTLVQDVRKFNGYFMDKEELFVIKAADLQNQLTEVPEDSAARRALRSQFVDLHGDMVLLLHWSMLNYAAVAKILKKHDKQSDVHLKRPLMPSVLAQPFRSTENMTNLIRQTEQHIKTLFASEDQADTSEASMERAEAMDTEALLVKWASTSLPVMRTHAALEMWNELSSTAVTPSTILPVPPHEGLGPEDGAPSLDRASKTGAGDSSARGSVGAPAVASPAGPDAWDFGGEEEVDEPPTWAAHPAPVADPLLPPQKRQRGENRVAVIDGAPAGAMDGGSVPNPSTSEQALMA